MRRVELRSQFATMQCDVSLRSAVSLLESVPRAHILILAPSIVRVNAKVTSYLNGFVRPAKN
jgi:hypothetical protein